MRSDNVCGICNCQIKENTLFEGFSEAHVDAFKDAIVESLHKKRSVVYMEGEDCTGLYIVRSGRVKLVRSAKSGKEQIIKILRPGDLLGLEVFYDAATYANTAVAMEDSDLCFVDKATFFKILSAEPEIATRLIVALGKELDRAYERIGNMGLLNAREKLAHLICALAKEYGVKKDGKIKLHLALSRLEMAELLGITQETSIRLLKGFEEEGILDVKRKELVISSIEKLEALCGHESR
jgi:CRP/FNR family transcriptional regulator